MGLAEKKASRDFQQNRLEALQKQLNKEAGFDIELEVNWDTLEVDKYAHLYDEAWPKVYFHPLIKAFKEMCSDDFARDIIKESLKKVVIQNYSDNYAYDRFAEFKKGVLTLNHSPITNIHHENERAANIQFVVEKEL
ncbi:MULTISPECIES: hypothetical protein [Alkalimonas]|uniref:Uncharacterized protein n=1 Tax=Alkalimonas mucilaginosa TaxID=3057676 RepID=A0ABU7JIH6_9GAMM|nr:hypothetical protein [Alkalimonas sp. MEB004]MEE2025502.1 hypothetical protein [Alkalimonas sp. MEB004]